MSIRCRLTFTAAASALALMVGTSAFGQAQSKDQQKCINTLNKDTAKVGATQGKENSGCVKAGTKGTATSGCVTADSKGKVAKAKSKTTADETKNGCLGGNAPNIGYAGGANGNTHAQAEEVNLFSDTYGTTDPTIVISTVKATGGCQSAVTKDLEKLIATKWKQYLACKKNTLKNGASNAAALQACLTGDPNSVAADPKGKKAGAVAKLNGDITGKCTGVTVATAFPGGCSGSTTGTLGTCLDHKAECRLCLAINAIDGINADCDLFDDGVSNGSCGIPTHKCVLGGGPANSYVNIYSAAFPVPLAFDTTGSSLDIGGAGTVGVCRIQNFAPINIIGIGFVCINPSSGCPNGTRYCGPGAPASGPALGVDVLSDGNIGTCPMGNTQCATACTAQCPTEYGAGFAMLSSSCTGFCTGTAPANMACTTDAQCAAATNGSCNGPDNPGVNAGICQCSCIKTDAFGASDPGDMQCNLGSDLKVEMAAPCNGTDVLINVGQTCIPISTQRAHSRIDDGNFIGGSTVPGAMPGPNANDQTGNPLACATLDASTTTAWAGVGSVNFFGSTIGDLAVGLKATCQ